MNNKYDKPSATSRLNQLIRLLDAGCISVEYYMNSVEELEDDLAKEADAAYNQMMKRIEKEREEREREESARRSDYNRSSYSYVPSDYFMERSREHEDQIRREQRMLGRMSSSERQRYIQSHWDC